MLSAHMSLLLKLLVKCRTRKKRPEKKSNCCCVSHTCGTYRESQKAGFFFIHFVVVCSLVLGIAVPALSAGFHFACDIEVSYSASVGVRLLEGLIVNNSLAKVITIDPLARILPCNPLNLPCNSLTCSGIPLTCRGIPLTCCGIPLTCRGIFPLMSHERRPLHKVNMAFFRQ